MNQVNFAFFGTPDVARKTLLLLKEEGYLPALIITSPDAPAGRGLEMRESPVAIFARENNIPCLKPEKFDEELADKLTAINYELFIVVAYGKMIPESILNLPRLGSYNIHYSLLPKYRGASPVESAILNGEEKTGVSIQKMVYKMDAGPIVAMAETKIGPEEKTPELRERLIQIGSKLLADNFKAIASGEVSLTPQDETGATFATKIKKEDGLLNLNNNPVKNYNKFRAFAIWPRVFYFHNSKRVIITDAKLEDGKFVIKKIIPEGGKEQNYENSIYSTSS